MKIANCQFNEDKLIVVVNEESEYLFKHPSIRDFGRHFSSNGKELKPTNYWVYKYDRYDRDLKLDEIILHLNELGYTVLF
jgi:hypothetical protein